MQGPIASVFGWILRNFFTFLIIVAVLVAGNWLWGEYQAYKALPGEKVVLEDAAARIGAAVNEVTAKVTAHVRGLQTASSAILTAEIAKIDRTIEQKRVEQQRYGPDLRKLLARTVVDDGVAWAKLGVEIECLRQEREFLSALHTLAATQTELAKRRLDHERIYQELLNNRSQQEELRAAHPIKIHIPFTDAKAQLDGLKMKENVLLGQNQAAYDGYQAQRKRVETIEGMQRNFEIATTRINELLSPLPQAIEAKDTLLRANPFEKLSTPVKVVIPTAIGILIGLIVTPIGIKAFFYFVLAPIAERRAPICLLPEASGTLEHARNSSEGHSDEIRMSGVSREILIDSTNELLVHSEYLQSSSLHGSRDTQWLLDWKYPLTSIASGMVVLTRIRTDEPATEVLSAPQDDPLGNVGVLSLPEGSAMVLQPRSLVGVLAPRGRPVRITRHWRVFSAHAWLTLQFRYLVFHGPAKLIVKGCRGIRVEMAGSGRRINQAATLGFSANLKYSNTRSRPFVAYLLAKQGLLEDSFVGDRGFFVYEEMPHVPGRAGVTGRSLEALVDSMLKAFGI